MGAAGLWAGRPSWRGPAKWCVGVSDISMHTGRGNPGVDMLLGGCSWFCRYGVDIAGWRRASSNSSGHGGYGAAVAGRGRLSPLSSSCPVIRTPCRKVSPSCHEIPISRAQRPTTPAGYEGAVRSPHANMLWSLHDPPASGSPIVTGHQMPPLDYGTACASHRRQPECWYCPGPGLSADPARS